VDPLLPLMVLVRASWLQERGKKELRKTAKPATTATKTETSLFPAASKPSLFDQACVPCQAFLFWLFLFHSHSTLSREHSHQIKKGLIIPQFQTGIPLLLTLSKQTCGAEKEERLLRVPSIQARGHLPIQNCQMDFHYIERVWGNWSHLKQGPPNVLQ